MASSWDITPIHSSWLSRWDARWKIVAYGLAMISTTWLRSDAMLALAVAGAAILLLSGRPDWGWLSQRIATMSVFLLPFVAYLLVAPQNSGQGEWIRLALRAALYFLLAASFVATTRVHLTAAALSSLGMPPLPTRLLLMTHRYVWLIRDQWQRIRTAMKARGFQFRPSRRCWRTTGLAAATLFLAAEDRAQRVAAAMRCRGFNGRFRGMHPPQTRGSDVAKFFLLVGVAAALAAFDRMDAWLEILP
ncbi:MAG: energy-coupling factor transporter transmembrane protein EcfT [Gemmataceae bacterium]|nr:energy-coupling factor transporter transmembrane protein EcfT [Gemmataceae bacterium]